MKSIFKLFFVDVFFIMFKIFSVKNHLKYVDLTIETEIVCRIILYTD
jgi:hypothetical protein